MNELVFEVVQEADGGYCAERPSTLNSILRSVAQHKNVSREAIL